MDAFVAGVILLLVIPIVIWDGAGSVRSGFDSAFWARPLEDMLDTIRGNRAAWYRLGIVWIPITVLLGAGLTGFSLLLAGEGQPVLAGVGIGAFLLVSACFAPAVVVMVAVAGAAADGREVAPLVRAIWKSAWWIERAFVIGANLAYVAWGIAIVDSGYPAVWVGWVAIVTGGAIAGWATFNDYFFQHMALITPIALGVALVLV